MPEASAPNLVQGLRHRRVGCPPLPGPRLGPGRGAGAGSGVFVPQPERSGGQQRSAPLPAPLAPCTQPAEPAAWKRRSRVGSGGRDPLRKELPLKDYLAPEAGSSPPVPGARRVLPAAEDLERTAGPGPCRSARRSVTQPSRPPVWRRAHLTHLTPDPHTSLPAGTARDPQSRAHALPPVPHTHPHPPRAALDPAPHSLSGATYSSRQRRCGVRFFGWPWEAAAVQTSRSSSHSRNLDRARGLETRGSRGAEGGCILTEAVSFPERSDGGEQPD